MQLADYDPPKPYRQQCRHILTNGLRCQSPCLKTRGAAGDAPTETHDPFCYFHHTTRHPVTGLKARRARQSTFELPLIEDRSAIQSAINEILARIASNDLDPRRAGLLLYGLQIASLNQSAQEAAARPRAHTRHAAPEEPLAPVHEITHHPDFGTLAPIADYAEPDEPYAGYKSLGRRLSEALDRAKAEAAKRVAAAEAREKAETEAAAAEAAQEETTQQEAATPVIAEPCAINPAPAPSEPTESHHASVQVPNPDSATALLQEGREALSSSSTPEDPTPATLAKLEAAADPEDAEPPLHTKPGEAAPRLGETTPRLRKPAPRPHRYRWPSNPGTPGTARPSHKTHKPYMPPPRWPYHR